MAFSARWTAAAAMVLAITAPASALNLPFGLGQEGRGEARPAPRREPAPVQMAQASDAGQRLMQLEEENRRLNGKVEELSFQMLQIQEQLRKMQEDNDFRFQELEGGTSAGSAGAGKKRTEAAPPAATPGAAAAGGSGDAEFNAATQPAAGAKAPAAGGDEIGTLLGGGGLDVGSIAAPPKTPVSGSDTVASVAPASAGELYDLAYNYLLAGDYQLAENSFRQYAQTYPDAKDVPDAQYWLGESLYAQAKFADAAETFLNAQKAYPKSGKAPEMMLKLGMSLSKLDNRETACVTFKEVSRRYPQMSANVKRKLDAETKATSC